MHPSVDGPSSTYVPPSTQPDPAPPVVAVETKPEESLNSAGQRFGASAEQMAKANPGVSNGDAPLAAGTRVNIPTGEGAGLATAVTLEAGESPADLARASGVSEDALRTANGLGPGEAVYPGTRLLVPAHGGGQTGVPIAGPGGNGAPKPGDADALLTPEGLAKQFPSLAGRKPEDMQKAAENARKLKDGTPQEKVQALAALTRDLQPKDLDKLAKELKLEKNGIYTLVTDKAALGALSKLADPEASAADKADAALSLTKKLGDLVPGKAGDALAPFLKALPAGNAIIKAYNTFTDPKSSTADKISAGLTLAEDLGKLAPAKLKEALNPILSALPAGKALVDAISKWADPQASGLDKAKATLALAQAVRDSAGEAFPNIAHNLRSLDGGLRSIGAGLTLLDPNASLEDKAKAALTLASDVPQLAGDMKALKQFLTEQRIPAAEAQRISEQIQRLPAVERLPESMRTGIDPSVARNLTPEQADQLARRYADNAEALRTAAVKDIDPADANKVAQALQGAEKSAKEFGESINQVFKQLKDPQAVQAFLKSFDGAADNASRKALVEALAGMKPGAADKLLTSTINGKPGGDVLASAIGKLDGDSDALQKLSKILAESDGRTAKFALELADAANPKALKGALDAIGDAKLAGKALGAMAAVLDKVGVKLTAQIAEKVLKGIAKAVPIAGAVPAGMDAARMAKIAADTSLPPDIRYMAMQAAKLNGTDAALSVAEPFIAEFFGIPVAADVALAIAELGLDIAVTSQMEKAKDQGSSYEAPDWMRVANVTMAASQGPQGALELASIYGPKGAVELTGSVARLGGNAAIKAAELQQRLAAQGVGEGMHLTAQGLHTLADMIRNPDKYGEAAKIVVKNAVDQLNKIAQGTGALAIQAGKQLAGAVNELRKLGEKGLETLGWIAQNPGEAATMAAKALGDMAQQGLRLATEAGAKIAQQALAALGAARDVVGAANKAVNEAIRNTVDTAVSLGQKGIETLGWIANNPGAAAQIAQKALVDVASKAGQLATAAYDQLVGLGQRGVELIKDVAGNLKDAGEAGVKMLKYAIDHPGEAAEAVRKAAMDGLKSIAEGTGRAAEAAAGAISDFVSQGLKEAKDTAAELLKSGGAAAERIARIWSEELSAGAKEVIDGLADVGDAGKEALGKLKNAGVGYARDVWNNIWGEGIPFIPGI